MVPFKSTVSIPKIKILEEEFNFGDISYGNSGIQRMTLRNQSSLITTLIMDLRETSDRVGIEGIVNIQKVQPTNEELGLKPEEKPKQADVLLDEEEIFMKLDRHPDEVKTKSGDDFDDFEHSEDEDEEDYEDISESKIYQIKVAPKSKLYFDITYSPKAFDNYDFLLPITIKGYHSINDLERFIKCSGK